MTPRRIWTSLLALIIGAAAIAAPRSEASESLRPSLKQIAAAVAKIAESRGERTVNVGQFIGPPAFNSNAGPGIQIVLSDELTKHNVQVTRFNAALGVRGEYLYTSTKANPDSPHKQIRLKVVLTDGSGQPLTALNREVDLDEADAPEDLPPSQPAPPRVKPQPPVKRISVKKGVIDLDTFTDGAEAAALLGVTYDFERSGLGLDVTKDVVQDSFDRPLAEIVRGTAVRSSSDSPYELEIYVGNRPQPLFLDEGQPIVELKKGQSFVLKLTNRSTHDISTALTLDGVNSFAFSTARDAEGKPLLRYIGQRNKFQWIKGWHESFTSIKQFQVDAFRSAAGPGQSPAAQFGTESSLGMLTVVIRGSWQGDEGPPADEPSDLLVDGGDAPTPAFGEPAGIAFSKSATLPQGDDPGERVAVASETATLPAPTGGSREIAPGSGGDGGLFGSADDERVAIPTKGASEPAQALNGAAQTDGAPSEFETNGSRGVFNEEPQDAHPPTRPKSPANEKLAITQGKAAHQASNQVSGRTAGVVRSIITIRYDK